MWIPNSFANSMYKVYKKCDFVRFAQKAFILVSFCALKTFAFALWCRRVYDASAYCQISNRAFSDFALFCQKNEIFCNLVSWWSRNNKQVTECSRGHTTLSYYKECVHLELMLYLSRARTATVESGCHRVTIYDTIESLTRTRQLSIQLYLAHVARKRN